jgi:hypothetical protein
MSSSVTEIQVALAQRVEVNEDTLVIELIDGHLIMIALAWYPCLWYGIAEERSHSEIVRDGILIQWPDLGDGISVPGSWLDGFQGKALGR